MNKEKTEGKSVNEMSFEEIFKQNERRIHYHIHRLGIRDLNFALERAHKNLAIKNPLHC